MYPAKLPCRMYNLWLVSCSFLLCRQLSSHIFCLISSSLKNQGLIYSWWQPRLSSSSSLQQLQTWYFLTRFSLYKPSIVSTIGLNSVTGELHTSSITHLWKINLGEITIIGRWKGLLPPRCCGVHWLFDTLATSRYPWWKELFSMWGHAQVNSRKTII